MFIIWCKFIWKLLVLHSSAGHCTIIWMLEILEEIKIWRWCVGEYFWMNNSSGRNPNRVRYEWSLFIKQRNKDILLLLHGLTSSVPLLLGLDTFLCYHWCWWLLSRHYDWPDALWCLQHGSQPWCYPAITSLAGQIIYFWHQRTTFCVVKGCHPFSSHAQTIFHALG